MPRGDTGMRQCHAPRGRVEMRAITSNQVGVVRQVPYNVSTANAVARMIGSAWTTVSALSAEITRRIRRG